MTYYPLYQFVNTYDHALVLKLDAPVSSIQQGDLSSDLSCSGSGFVIRNNYISNNRARGLILKASDGLVEGNFISYTALPGVLLSAEARQFIEGGVVSNVLVKDNILYKTGMGWHSEYWLQQAGAIALLFQGYDFLGHRDIVIEDNDIFETRGMNIQINNAAGVTVNRNRFYDSHQAEDGAGLLYGADHSALVWIDKADGVTFGTGADANYYFNMGACGDPQNTVITTTNSMNVSGVIYCGD